MQFRNFGFIGWPKSSLKKLSELITETPVQAFTRNPSGRAARAFLGILLELLEVLALG